MAIQLNINSIKGDSTENIELSDKVFGAELNEALVHQVVVAYLAGGRRGTRAQKNRSAVSGGGSKPWRQKGTGKARAGTIRSPIFYGGGRTFPASTQNFSQKVNKKMYRAAMRSIFSELTRQERVMVVDEIVLEAPKTRVLLESLKKLGVNSGLLVLAIFDNNITLSARNLKSIDVCTSSHINPVDLIRSEKVIVTKQAVQQIDEALQ